MALFELIWVFSTYLSVFLSHTFKKSVPIARPGFDPKKHVTLLCHLILPVFEVFRYHVRATFPYDVDHPPRPERIDVLLCILHSVTSLTLASRLRVGDKIISRPNYQTMTILRLGLSICAFAYDDPIYYAASIRIINGFVYPRIFFKVINHMKLLPNYTAVYTAAIFVASLMSLHETGLWLGPHLFLFLLVANIAVNRWVAVTVSQWRHDGGGRDRSPMFALALLKAGFVEQGSMK